MKFLSPAIAQWYRGLMRHPQYRWLVILGTLVYLLSPIDLAPDLIPIFGQIDDVLLLSLLLNEAINAIRIGLDQRIRPDAATAAAPDAATQTIDTTAEALD